MKKNLRSFQWWYQEWIKPVIIAVVLALIIRTFAVQPFKIPTNSMAPTFLPGDRIFVSKIVYGPKIPLLEIRLPGMREPELGDIVVFRSPIEDKYLVKRFIARGGETVSVSMGDLYLDGEKIEDNPMRSIFYHNYPGPTGLEEPYLVPEGKFYVLGDNSANSMDSRYWGVVPEENMVGKVVLIHWPFRRIRLVRDGV